MSFSSIRFQQIFEDAELNVSSGENSYKGIPLEALLTSAQDFKNIFCSLKDCHSFLDLGCAHGIGVIEFAKMFPHSWSGGIDIENSRLEVGRQLAIEQQLVNCHFIQSDLLKDDIPRVDVYFLYFPTGIVLDRILDYLGTQDTNFRIIAIESHGDLLPRLKKETWLELESEIPLHVERYYPYAQVFKKIANRTSDLHSISFKNKFLSLRQGQRLWIAESFGLEWVREDEFLLKTPPRTIKEGEILEVYDLEFLSPTLQKLLQLRRLGSLIIKTDKAELRGEIRKIFFSPKIELEISTAGTVNWDSIEKISTETSICYDSSSGFVF